MELQHNFVYTWKEATVKVASLGQSFGENLVIFCKLSTLIHVTNGALRPYHLDNSTFNYRGTKTHISFYYLLR